MASSRERARAERVSIVGSTTQEWSPVFVADSQPIPASGNQCAIFQIGGMSLQDHFQNLHLFVWGHRRESHQRRLRLPA